jgi:hypothetical protein
MQLRPEPTLPPSAADVLYDPAAIDTDEAALEVVILWGEQSILHVEHLCPPRAFSVGDAPGADFLIGSDILGGSQLPVVVEADSGWAAVVADGAGGRLEPLQPGVALRSAHGGFTFIVTQVCAARRLGAATRSDGQGLL